MKIVSFTPIKLNNERTPGKNIRPFDDGTPLCQLIFKTISSVSEIDEAYCFCSNSLIKQYLTGKVQYLQRSQSLDSKETTGNDIIAAFLKEVDADIYVSIQATAPFLKPSTITECINAVKSGRYDSATTVSIVHEFLWKDNTPLNFDPSNIARTQDLPHIVCETAGIYVFTKKLFEKTSRRVGFNPFFKEINKIESMDIDYPEDFEIANSVYMMMVKNNDCRNY